MARSSDSSILLSLLRDKTFQAKEIRRVIMLSLMYLAITTALVAVFYHYMLSRLLGGAAPMLFVSEDIALVNESLPAMGSVLGVWILAMLGINLVITIIVAIYITRKLGNPILAIKRALREIGNGNLEVQLRSTDNGDFGEIVSELNTAMHTVRVQINTAKQSMAEVNNLQTRPPTETSRDTNSRHIDTALNSCHSALEFFQVGDFSKNDPTLADDHNNKAS